jgi:glycosyltransferase involved in cell wall biosynthesis
VADYSAVLVRGLCEYFDVTLAIDDYELSDLELRTAVGVVRFTRDNIDWDRYDFKLYNIGNEPRYHGHIYGACLEHPGTVILHDFVIYHLVVGWYMNRPEFYAKIHEIAGSEGLRIIEGFRSKSQKLLQCGMPQLLPLTGELLASENSILCHSQYTLAQCARLAPKARLGQIRHVSNPTTGALESRGRLLVKWGIPEDALLVGSFGFVHPTKLNHVVCEAVRRHNQGCHRKIYYVMVGAGDYVRDSMDEFMRLTGFVDSLEFAEWIAAIDLVINLRFPSNGETSGALIRALAAGKPCIVTNDAWFSELEDDIVIKIAFPYGEGAIAGLEEALKLFSEIPEMFRQMGARARAVLERDYSVDIVCRDIIEFLYQGRNDLSADALGPHGLSAPV